MKLIVSIPAFNEVQTIEKVIKGIQSTLKPLKYDFKILVVDDGSTDATSQAAKQAGAIVVSHPHNYGLAETFRTEMKECLKLKPDVIVHTDADGQYLAKEIPKLLKPIEQGKADLVLGSRFKGKIESMPWLKKWGNRAFSRAISNIIKFQVSDCQTGFRAFTKEVAEKIPITSNHTYTQEMIIRAVKEKFRVKEVPVFFAKRISGKSRLMSSPIEYAARAWINILRIYRDYEPLKFFGSIGAALLAFSFLVLLAVLYKMFFQFIDLDRLIPTLLISVLFFVSGLQILLFGFLADKK